MTIAEYEAGVAELERKLARIAELRAAIKAQRGEMAPEQIQAFAFNDLRSQPADVTGVTPGPETVEGAGLSRQKLGEEQFAAMTDSSLQPTMTGQPSHDVDEITNQVNRILARGQGGDVPAEATRTRQIQTPEFEAAMAPVQPDIGPVEKPIMESVDEAVKAAGPAFVHSLTMGAITLSQRDQKAIESSPIAGAIASFAGDIAAIVGPMKGAKLTLAGFKRVAPSLIKEWFAGGEEVGKVLVNAAAREGLGGAYWNVLRAVIEETKSPEEQIDWNERLTQLATDVGMFAMGGAAFEGVAAGIKKPGILSETRPTAIPEGRSSGGAPGEGSIVGGPAERATAKEVLETVSPVKEAEAARAEAVGRPAPKSTEEALGVVPKEQATAEQMQALADKFPTGKRAKEIQNVTETERSGVRGAGSRESMPATGDVRTGDKGIAGKEPLEPELRNERVAGMHEDRSPTGQGDAARAISEDTRGSAGIEIAGEGTAAETNRRVGETGNPSLEAVAKRAAEQKPDFDRVLQETADQFGFKNAPKSRAKSVESIASKVKRNTEVGKEADPEKLGDLLAGSIIADDVTMFDQVVDALRKKVDVIEVDKRLDLPSSIFGYRGYHVDARLPSGQRVEIQVHTPATWEAKEYGDAIYQKWRSKSPKEIAENQVEFLQDMLESNRKFDAAWKEGLTKPQSPVEGLAANSRLASSSEIRSASMKEPAVIESETSLPVSKSKTGLPGQSPVKSNLPLRQNPPKRSSISGDLGSIDIQASTKGIRQKPTGSNKKITTSEATIGTGSSGVRDVKLSEISTDPERFQNRSTEFSEKTAQAVAERYDPNLFDPIVLWRDPKNGKSYVISGHSRLEGMRRRKAEAVPARFFAGSEAEAIRFGKIEGNRLGTKEDLSESVRAYKRAKQEGYTKAKLKDLFAADTGLLENIQHLNSKGQFMQQLTSETSAGNFPYIKRISGWVGELRGRYPDKLTDAHEQQMFDFFYRSERRNYDILKDDFEALVTRQVDTFDFDPTRALVFKRAGDIVTGTRARADTGAAERMIDELKLRQKQAKTTQEYEALQKEIEKLRKNIGEAVRKQTDMFSAPGEDVGAGGAEVGVAPIRPLGDRIKDAADIFEKEAKARIAKRSESLATAYDVVGASVQAAANLVDWGIVGAAKMAKGAVTLADFTAAMVAEYGEEIRRQIEPIYKRAKEIYHNTRAGMTVDEHLEYMRQISVPFEYRPRRFERMKEIRRRVTDVRTRGMLGLFEKSEDAVKRFAEDDLESFTIEAWQAGVPVMRNEEGVLLPVFESKGQTEALWARAKQKARDRVSGMQRIRPQEAHSIAVEARRQFADELVNMGVAQRIRRTAIKLSPDVKRKTDLSLAIVLKREIGAENLKAALSHLPENDLAGRQATMARLAVDHGLMVPAVRAQGTFVPLDFAAYRGFRDVSGETLDPTRMIQQIDGALSVEGKVGLAGQAGPAERYVLWRTRDMVKQKMAWMADMEATGKEALQGLSRKQRELATDVLEEIASKDVDLSLQGLLARSEIRDITKDPKILTAVLRLREIYDEVLDWQNALRVQRSQKEISKRAFYSPRKMKEAAAWQELMGKSATPENLFTTGSTLPDFVLPNKPHNPHELQRILLEPKYELERDALKLLESYLNTAARDIFDTSIIQNAKAFIDQLEPMGFGRSAESLRDWMGQAFAGSQHSIDKKISSALTSAFGETIGNRWQKWSGEFRGALARSVFPGNITWNLFIQTSSGALTHTRYGTANSIKGAVRWFTDKGFREEVAANAYSYIVKTQRAGKVSSQDFNQGLARAVQLEKGTLETATDYANFLSEWIERNMTGWSVAAGYEDGLKKGLTGKALWEYASDAGAKTQSMYNKEDLPGLLRSAGVKTVAPFQTFGFEMYNTIKEIMGRTGTPPATAQERVKIALRFLAGATAINMIGNEASGRKPWEPGSFVPFYSIFGKPIEAALKGESLENSSVRGLPSPTGIGVAFAAAIEDLIKDGEFDKLVQWVIRYGTAGVGIPAGTELARLYEGILAVAREGKFDKDGTLLFPISDAKEQIRTIFGGPWASAAGQERIGRLERGVIEIAPAKSGVGRAAQTTAEALPIVGDVVEFRRRKEDEGGIEIVPDASRRRSSRRRVRRR